MPFVSQAQRAACYAQAARDRKAGRTPKWNCKKYEKHRSKGTRSKRNKKRKSYTRKSRTRSNRKTKK